jgi:hypothetical protein
MFFTDSGHFNGGMVIVIRHVQPDEAVCWQKNGLISWGIKKGLRF